MPFTPPIDGPPPSPATDPAAAKEAGQPQPGMSGLAGTLAAPISSGMSNSGMPQGQDLSGILMLGEKVEQGMIAIAGAVPAIAGEIGQAKELFMAALAKFVSDAGTSNGSMPGTARGQVVTQAGPQFPGGGQGSGRPY